MTLMIGGLAIPEQAGFDIKQTLSEINAQTLLRSKNGTGILQSRWRKFQSTISGSGWLPDGLYGLDIKSALEVACVEPLSITNISNSIVIPGIFRAETEYAPQGVALVNGEPVNTGLTLVGNIATLTVVPAAASYQVIYWPILTGFITINRQFDLASQTWSWSIEFLEQ